MSVRRLERGASRTLVASIVASLVAVVHSGDDARAAPLDCADKTAVERVNDGAQAAFRGEHYAEASEMYADVYGCTNDASVLFNLAKSYANVGRWVDAKVAMTRFLASASGLSDEVRQAATEELSAISSHVGAVTVRADAPSATVSIDGAPVGPAPVGPIDHAVGKVRVDVTAKGRAPYTREFELKGGASLEVEAALPMDGEAAAPRRPPVWMWIGYGVAGAGGLVAAITGGLSIAKVDDIRMRCDGDLCPKSTEPDRDDAAALANASNVSLAIGAAGAIVGVVGTIVFFTSEPASTAPAIAIRIGPAGIALSGAF